MGTDESYSPSLCSASVTYWKATIAHVSRLLKVYVFMKQSFVLMYCSYNTMHLISLNMSLFDPGFTYFYKGKEYWKFNNQLLRVEHGYPRSILRDFMGCDGLPPDPDWDWSLPVAEERNYDNGDVDVVIKLDSSGGTEKAVAIAIPCVLALCMMVLLYTVFQFRRKSTQRHILYCKRSMQEWV